MRRSSRCSSRVPATTAALLALVMSLGVPPVPAVAQATTQPTTQPTVFEAVASAFVRAGRYADTHQAPVDDLLLISNGGPTSDTTREAYLTFDLGDLEASAVQHAALRLYGEARAGDGSDRAIDVHEVLDPGWDDRTVTWNTAPARAERRRTATVVTPTPAWHDWDLTELVREALAAGETQLSVSLRDRKAFGGTVTALRGHQADDRGPQLVLNDPDDIAARPQPEDFAELRRRILQAQTGSGIADYSDPVVAQQVALLDDHAEGLWARMHTEPGRTYLFDERANLQDPTNVAWTFSNLRWMAAQYATPGSRYHRDAALLADLVTALEWMHEHAYYVGSTERVEHYHSVIGSPKTIGEIVILLYDQLDPGLVAAYDDAVEYYTPVPFYWSQGRISTDANRLWLSRVVAMWGAITDDSAQIEMGVDAMLPEMQYNDHPSEGTSYDRDGFYRDGSYIGHGAYPYNGGYGLAAAQTLIEAVALYLDSPWAITDPAVNNVYAWVYDAFEPLVFKGAMMDMVRGRNIARPYDQDHISGHGVIRAVLALVESAPHEHAQQYRAMVKHWIQSDTFRAFFAAQQPAGFSGTRVLEQLGIARSLVDDEGLQARQLIAHTQYPQMDRVVHRRSDFALGIAMHSTRIANYEVHQSGENRYAWHTADGMTYLYNDDLAQFSDDFWPTVDPYRLPGTTVSSTERAPSSGASQFQPDDWVGGAALAEFGVAGMEFRASEDRLSARKSWFMFDDEVVALGSDVASRSGHAQGERIETVVENRKLVSPDARLTVDGAVQDGEPGWSAALDGVTWAHLEGAGGYVFPEPTDLQARRETRTGSWFDVNPQAGIPTEEVSRDYVSLGIDHGQQPEGEGYGYVLLPNAEPAAVGAYAADPDVAVLADTSDVHAVAEDRLGVEAAAVWAAAGASAGSITTDAPAAVVLHESASDQLEVAVSDPTQTRADDVVIELDRAARDVVALDPRLTVEQLSPTIRVRADVAGARGASLRAVFEPAPAASVTAALDPAAPDGGSGWYTGDVTVALTADPAGAAIEYRLDDGDWTAYTAPVVVSADGRHRVEYRAGASRGDVAAEAVEFRIDASAPVTQATVQEPRPAGRVMVTLSADDARASGVARTEYRFGRGRWHLYDQPFVIGPGLVRRLTYRSVDLAGNVEDPTP